MLKAALPELERVTLIGALVELTVCDGKFKVLGDKEAVALVPVPVPLSETELVPVVASLVMLSVPVKLPEAVGRKVTPILAVCVGDKVRGRDGFEVMTKAVPAVNPVSVSGDAP